ncbi:phage shock protein C (PspC) family protein [Bhargavaea ginsengi]|uniref:Phage shock protein C (PspC) family protein n=1 Tax=Bhargavaea ginsengi TaxID=426757 RepID=A0A1H6ZEF7_9BACL|nr:PspC domain-containing protein [Bhargavaea ginsengi]SEJ51086.1 phage shock protein C (PspC) family protein [Bhargavaea ginsengi]
MKKLRKSSKDRAIVGVCGGIAEFFGISSFVVRLIFLMTISVSLWVYLVLSWALEDSYLLRQK